MSSATVTSQAIPLLDLKAQHSKIREQVLAAIVRVVDSQQFILGSEVDLLEQEIASYSQTKFAIGCASGSDALLLALLAAGIQPGDAVVTTPYTFFATVSSICRIGATPIFVDVDETFNLDVHQLDDVFARYPRVNAVIPVHLFGGCADMDPISQWAKERGIKVIEDLAQALGAEYKGRRAGSIGQIGCISFFPSKNLGAYGEAGMLTTNDAYLADQLRVLRVHGSRQKYLHESIGLNSRLDAIQAAVLRVKLRYLDEWTAGRQRNAALYLQTFESLRTPVGLPGAPPYANRHIFNQFVIRTTNRNQLKEYLAANAIGSEVYYPLPMHLQPCFEFLGYKKGDFPVSERLAEESLALPVYPELAPEAILRVCETVHRFVAS